MYLFKHNLQQHFEKKGRSCSSQGIKDSSGSKGELTVDFCAFWPPEGETVTQHVDTSVLVCGYNEFSLYYTLLRTTMASSTYLVISKNRHK